MEAEEEEEGRKVFKEEKGQCTGQKREAAPALGRCQGARSRSESSSLAILNFPRPSPAPPSHSSIKHLLLHLQRWIATRSYQRSKIPPSPSSLRVPPSPDSSFTKLPPSLSLSLSHGDRYCIYWVPINTSLLRECVRIRLSSKALDHMYNVYVCI